MAPSIADRVNATLKLFDDEKYKECASEMRDILNDDSLPRYYRIKCRIILATTHDDRYDAERDRL